MGNKIAGTIYLIFGALCVFYLYYSQRLILDNNSFILTRYSKVISVGYAGLGFSFFGILYCTGFLVPYYKANYYEKAKSNIYSSIFVLPFFLFWLIIASVSFNSIEIRTYKTLGIVFFAFMVLFCLWSFFSNLNTLKKRKT